MNISVIIPVKDDWLGLRSTLNSLRLAQSRVLFDDIECIVVDNNSSVSCELAVKDFQPLNLRVTKEGKLGSYAARNKGASISTGQYLLFIDANMTVLPDFFERLSMLDIEKFDYYGFNVKMRLVDNSIYSKYNFLRGFNVERSIRQSAYTPTCILLVRRDSFFFCGKFNDQLQSGGDYFFGQQIHKMGFKQSYLEEIVCYHPTRNSFRSLRNKAFRIIDGNIRINEITNNAYPELITRHYSLRNLRPKNYFRMKQFYIGNKIPWGFMDYIYFGVLRFIFYLYKMSYTTYKLMMK